jgi:trimeric autotransporter adhesin
MSRRTLSVLGVVALLIAGVAICLSYQKRHSLSSRTSATPTSTLDSTAPPFPTGIAVDDEGNVYVVAQKQNRVLRISRSRRITVIAGNGGKDFSGDGGPANQSSLNGPVGIALDSAGNVFIADTNNNRVRRVDTRTHTITTVAGNGALGGGTGALATESGIYQPLSVAIDNDENLYVGGMGGFGIKRVDAITHMTTGIMGAGMPGYFALPVPASGPVWVAADRHGRIFFADPKRNAVSEISLAANQVSPVAGNAICGFEGDGGPSAGALLCFPEGIAVAGHKEIFIADTGNSRIRRVDLSSGIITTAAGSGKTGYSGDEGQAVDAELNGPMGITVDSSGSLYIADTGNNCIRKVSGKSGTITTWASPQDLTSASSNGSGN